ncbi:hypothetical protein G6F40_016230 [Rhizopus arrhizus]|nr:hypothetical protein G6F40_016230 [Rhizopus arrhizus]
MDLLEDQGMVGRRQGRIRRDAGLEGVWRRGRAQARLRKHADQLADAGRRRRYRRRARPPERVAAQQDGRSGLARPVQYRPGQARAVAVGQRPGHRLFLCADPLKHHLLQPVPPRRLAETGHRPAGRFAQDQRIAPIQRCAGRQALIRRRPRPGHRGRPAAADRIHQL